MKSLIVQEAGSEVIELISRNTDLYSKDTLLVSTSNIFNILKEENNKYKSIINLEQVNDIKRLNKFFKAVNSKLPIDGVFVGCVETYSLRKKRILHKFPFLLGQIYYLFDFVFKRLFPKFSITKKIYFFITHGRNRVLSMSETYGRLYSCGFSFVEEIYLNNKLYFIFKKNKEPLISENPSYGPIFKMKRIGKNGKIIYCYKLRTMHAYSEFLQEYIYKKNNLASGGKFKEDFRVSTIGRFFRKFWIDELPMIINLLTGDLKIVGVRPLSQHYLSLYDEELRSLRIKYKPGLIPPFYVDLPKTLEEIMASEKRYLLSYQKNPIFTDFKYFFLAFYMIIFKRARSQ